MNSFKTFSNKFHAFIFTFSLLKHIIMVGMDYYGIHNKGMIFPLCC